MGAHGKDGIVSHTELDIRYPEEFRIECPCCKGKKSLYVESTNYVQHNTLQYSTSISIRCCHCMGLGFVMKDYDRVAIRRLARGSNSDAD